MSLVMGSKCKQISKKNQAKLRRFLASKSKTSSHAASEGMEEQESFPLKTVSSPAHMPSPEEGEELKKQISAPCYLQSLAENELPPFRRPGQETRPILLVEPFPIVAESDVIEMVAYAEADPQGGLKKFLTPYLVKKEVVNKYDIIERDFLIDLLAETIDYAAQRDFTAFQLSTLLTVYLTTHKYYKWYYWSAPVAIWNYFQELMVRLTIEDSPDAEEVFEPDECYDILTHFHTMYISNLPLIHILTFGPHRLRLNWLLKKGTGKDK